MFTLVEYVCLSQGYIRGRFVLHQQQSFLEEPSVEIPALIRPWIIVQYNQVNGEEFWGIIDSFRIVFTFSVIVCIQNLFYSKGFQSYDSHFSKPLLR